MPLLLLVVALLDDLTRATTATQVITQPLDSLHPADTASSIHLSSQTSDRSFIVPRLFRRTIQKCASSLNEISSKGHANRRTLDHLTTLTTRLSPSSAPPLSLTSSLSLTSPLLLTPPLLSSSPSSSSSSSSSLSSLSLSKVPSSLTPLNIVVVRHLSVPTPARDEENEEITARRERAKRVPISKRSKLKDQSSPNFIDPWPEAWRRIDEHSLQPRKLESASPIDDGFRPAVRAFTPLLKPVFKFGESILRPENSLRDILLHESASKTTATTTTAVATTTTTRDIAYLGATRRTGSTEKDDVGGVTEDGIKDDKKSGRELVLVGNKDNGAVVVGGDSVIEWTTTTVAGPMSSPGWRSPETMCRWPSV